MNGTKFSSSSLFRGRPKKEKSQKKLIRNGTAGGQGGEMGREGRRGGARHGELTDSSRGAAPAKEQWRSAGSDGRRLHGSFEKEHAESN